MPESDKQKTLRDVWRIVFRRRWLFVLGACLFMLAALWAAQFLPLKYTGTAKFERRVDPSDEQSSNLGGDSFSVHKLTLQHELTGTRAIERVIEELGMARGLPRGPDGELTLPGKRAFQGLVASIKKDLLVSWEVRSERIDLVSVSFTHGDARIAEELPNTLVKNYINRVGKQIVDGLTESRDFLLKQVNTSTKRLEELRQQRIAFEVRHAGTFPDNPNLLEEQIRQLTADLDASRVQQMRARQNRERLKALAKPDASTDTPVQIIKGPNPDLARLKEQLRDNEEKLDIALTISGMRETHPTVQNLRQNIERLEKRIAETPAEIELQKVFGMGGGDSSLAMELAAVESELEMSTKEIERQQNRLTALEDLKANYLPIRQEYQRMTEQEKEQEQELRRWQGRLTQVAMALEAEAAERRTHLNTVQLAEEQFRPSSPKDWQVFGFAIVGGLAFGGLLVFLANTFDRSISTTEQAITYFDLPVYGVVGEIMTARDRMLRKLKLWLLGPAVALVVVAALAGATLNMVLLLKYPDQHKKWKAHPAGYVQSLFTNGDKQVSETP